MIRLLLRFCATVPNVLNDYDHVLKDSREDGYGIREHYMLPFLVKMKMFEDAPAAKLILQLMGFRSFLDLKFYYEASFPHDALISQQISALEALFYEETFDETDMLDRSDECYFSV